MSETEDAQEHTKTSTKSSWRAAIYIIFTEMAERFSYFGIAGNLVTYLTTVLGQPVASAAKSVNTWVGVSSVFPIIGAFVADSYLGRFKTILVASTIYLCGLILLTISTTSVIPRHLRKTFIYVALYVLSVGEGGHKPCVQTFAADQFDEESMEQRVAKSSFFNWWYLAIAFAATAAVLIVVYIEDSIGWTAGFGLLAGVVAGALVILIVGFRTYRRPRPAGSPFTRVAQVVVAAVRKRHVSTTRLGSNCAGIFLGDGTRHDAVSTLARTDQFRCLDNAMVIDELDESSGKSRNPWRLCPQNQVEEVKLVLRLLPVWLCCFMFFVAAAQLSTFFTKQGSTLDRSMGRHFKIPPASLQVFPGVSILAFVPIYDRVIVPFARNITGQPNGIPVLQRMGTGMFFIILTMSVCALVETKRVSVAREYGLLDMPKVVLPMRVWWMVPQYMLLGLSEALMVVGMQELFYDQMPEEMRSMGAAAYLSTIGVGNFLSTALISIVQAVTARGGNKWLINNLNRAHLNRFYWLLAGLNALNLGVFVLAAKGFVYKEVQKNEGDLHV